MRLLPDNRAVIDAIIEEAHAEVEQSKGVLVSRDVASLIVSKVGDLTASGQAWTTDYLLSLAEVGAAKIAADWRRKTKTQGHTKTGKTVSLPAYAGVIRKDAATGRSVNVQLPLFRLNPDDLKAHMEMLEKTRDTYSRKIACFRSAIEAMEAGDYAKARELLGERGAA